MPASEAFAGSEAIGVTEHSMTTDTAGPDVETSDGAFQPFLDLTDMIAGDQLQIRCYEKATSGGTQRLVEEWIRFGAQSPKVLVLPTLMLMHGWDWTLDALAGTITVTWSIRKVATPSEAFAGSEAVSTTEHSMTTDTAGPDVETSDGVFQPFLDVADMVTGDELQIRVYEKIQAADAQVVVYEQILTGAQSKPIWTCPALTLLHGWDMTLDALAGTITVDWSIRKIG